ncbi:cytochrome C biogenesis protein [candidate division KSB1 bacterium]|nr:MAG: cytochrome C biogenesis protein [candidate division KSB1 bacterium]
MIESLFTSLSSALQGSLWIALIASLTWGFLSILLSPCHLASIPLLIGFITSQESPTRKRVFALSSVFALGILATIAIIGLITAMAGRLLGDVGLIGNILVAAVFFFIGLYLMDLLPVSWSGFQFSSQRYSGLPAALVLGLLFGIGLGPCTFAFMAPVLGVVFQTATADLTMSVILLASFALGHCAVIVVAGMLANHIGEYLNWSQRTGIAVWIKRVCGFLVVLGGVYMIWKMF